MIVPPATILGGYGCWYAGEQFTIHNLLATPHNNKKKLPSPGSSRAAANNSTRSMFSTGMNEKPRTTPKHGIFSFAAGLLTLYGIYRVQFPFVQQWEQSGPNYERNNLHVSRSDSKVHVPPHKSSAAFQPPQTLHDLWERMGRSVIGRFGAGAVAFFCAGTVQTCVAAMFDDSF